MQLSSSSFANGTTIPRRFTCDGEDRSPPLGWTGAPARTRSFVLLCDDPDAAAGIWHHWAAYDIAADCAELAEGPARRQTRLQAGNQRFPATRLRWSLPTASPRPTPPSFPAACAADRSPAARQRPIVSGGRTRSAQASPRRGGLVGVYER
ncbi:YbhB/YbcL family Raf kinase inhibitor-like protein [Mesorhizobium sp.]|uniref:YbhB/YbcL family Raf kinase inhibitor-like protein n=1 Tax=Mesorhizobium sp. TaxID=1871066 RepID=UPI00344BD732